MWQKNCVFWLKHFSGLDCLDFYRSNNTVPAGITMLTELLEGSTGELSHFCNLFV